MNENETEKVRVVRGTSGDYAVKRGDKLVSNHGRRKAEAERKAARINAVASKDSSK